MHDLNRIPKRASKFRSCGILALIAAIGCVSSRSLRETQGEAHVVVSGQQSFETDGSASAGYLHPMAGPGFHLGLQLPAAQPRAPRFGGAALAFRTDSLPQVAEYRVSYFIESPGSRPKQWSSLIGGPNGSSISWAADSGIIKIQQSRIDGSLVGTFSVVFRCRHCDTPYSTDDHIAVEGRFNTRR